MDEAQVLARRMRGFFAPHRSAGTPADAGDRRGGEARRPVLGWRLPPPADLAVATPDATFWTPEAQWGTVGATQRLARIVGKRLARDMMFTGRRPTAAEALDVGLRHAHCRAGQPGCRGGRHGGSRTRLPLGHCASAKRCHSIAASSWASRAVRAGRGELLAIEENLDPLRLAGGNRRIGARA